MSSLQVGLVIVTGEVKTTGTARWTEIRDLALRAEEMGFDTVWVIDELLWRKDGTDQGFWDGVAMAGAVAAVTSRIQVGTWIMSALHRNPGIVAKAAETLDEISGGRFIFGLGAGHVWPGQAHAFGLPEDHIHSRFDEALAIIVPLIRDGHANVEGTYHAARDLVHRPVGPRPQDAPPGGHACGHLERVRGAARRRRGVPAEDGGLRGCLCRDRSRSGDGREVRGDHRRADGLEDDQRAGPAGGLRDVRQPGGDRGWPARLPGCRLHPGR